MALSPISRYLALERLVGNRVNRDFRRLIKFYVDDVGFIHLNFRRDDRHIRHRHKSAARRILYAHDHGLAFMDGKVRYRAVKRRGVCGLAKNVTHAR